MVQSHRSEVSFLVPLFQVYTMELSSYVQCDTLRSCFRFSFDILFAKIRSYWFDSLLYYNTFKIRSLAE